MNLAALVEAPPSKSVSHRKILLAALAAGESRLTRVLESDDVERTIGALRRVGAAITRSGEGEYRIQGLGGAPQAKGGEPPLACFAGESGTTARMLAAILAAGQGEFRIYGAGRLHERPMAELTSALGALGADVRFEGKSGFLPARIVAQGLEQKKETPWLPVRCDVSSQFLSSLLLAGPLTKSGLALEISEEKTVSWPYVGLTLQSMEDAGLPVEVEARDGPSWTPVDWRGFGAAVPGRIRFRIRKGTYRPLSGKRGEMEGDYSGAAHLLAAGALGPRPVAVAGLRRDSLQGDAAIMSILQAMGAQAVWEDDVVTVRPGPLRGITADMSSCPDLVPTAAVLAATASGPSLLRNVARLRAKESDRIAALVAELAKIGCEAAAIGDDLVVTPARKRNTVSPEGFCVHGDHRMAMSLALLELAGLSVVLDNPACVTKSFPGFWRAWRKILPQTRITEAL